MFQQCGLYITQAAYKVARLRMEQTNAETHRKWSTSLSLPSSSVMCTLYRSLLNHVKPSCGHPSTCLVRSACAVSSQAPLRVTDRARGLPRCKPREGTTSPLPSRRPGTARRPRKEPPTELTSGSPHRLNYEILNICNEM